MKRILILLTILSVGIYTTGSLHAQVGLKKLGQSTMNFLQVGISPKASSLGEAYTAVGTGVEAIFYNPAALAECDATFNAVFTTTQWIANIQYVAGAIAWNTGNFGTIGLSYFGVDYGDIYATSLLPKAVSDTDPLGYVDNGLMENVGSYALGLTYARLVNSQFLIGGSVRYVTQQLGDSEVVTGSKTNKATKLAFDLGLKYYLGFHDFRFGMSIRNFATAVKYVEITEQLPLVFNVGADIDLMGFINSEMDVKSSITLSTEFSHPNNYTERVSVGLDLCFNNMISLRGGYQSNLDFGGLSAGFGLTQSIAGKAIDISYSFSKYDVFDDVNRISVEISF